MANFTVSLDFLDCANYPVPERTDLLFYNADTGHLARGWSESHGEIVLIGAQWKPTHFAVHSEEMEKQAAFAAAVADCPRCTKTELCTAHALERHPNYAGRF